MKRNTLGDIMTKRAVKVLIQPYWTVQGSAFLTFLLYNIGAQCGFVQLTEVKTNNFISNTLFVMAVFTVLKVKGDIKYLSYMNEDANNNFERFIKIIYIGSLLGNFLVFYSKIENIMKFDLKESFSLLRAPIIFTITMYLAMPVALYIYKKKNKLPIWKKDYRNTNEIIKNFQGLMSEGKENLQSKILSAAIQTRKYLETVNEPPNSYYPFGMLNSKQCFLMHSIILQLEEVDITERKFYEKSGTQMISEDMSYILDGTEDRFLKAVTTFLLLCKQSKDNIITMPEYIFFMSFLEILITEIEKK